MIHFTFLKNCICISIVLILANFVADLSPTLYAQTCPTLPGGNNYGNIEANEYYPGILPSYVSVPASASSTVGGFYISPGDVPEEEPIIASIVPTLDGSTMGYVTLDLLELNLLAGAKLILYKGTISPEGLLVEIDINNYQSEKGKQYIVSGDRLIIVYYGSFELSENYLRFTTGDKLVTSCILEREIAVWDAFLTPNSYFVFDDIEQTGMNVASYSGDYLPLLPMCIAYVDQDKNIISTNTELSYCIDRDSKAPSMSYGYYPGQITFALNQRTDYDIDRSNGFTADDQLKAARLLWLINKSKSEDPISLPYYQAAVWETQEAIFEPESLAAEAETVVSILPSPIEPTFSITPPSGGSSSAKQGIDITLEIPFSWATTQAGQTNSVKLVIPSGVTVTSSIPENWDASTNILTIPSPSEPAILTLSSNSIGKYTIQAIYENEDYYNVNNLQIFEPCNSEFQNLLHVGINNTLRPFRSINIEWTDPLPVTLLNFNTQLENKNVLLSWQTAEEVNFSHFVVEKSYDTKKWEMIGKVSTNSSNQYSLVDPKSAQSITYYRLKMIDLDGTYALSDMKSVHLNAKASHLSLHPNPVATTLHITNLATEKVKQVKIYDLAGSEKILTADLKNNQVNVQSLSNGIYIVKIELQDGTYVNEKFIVSK